MKAEACLESIALLAEKMAKKEGGNSTTAPFLTIYKRSNQNPLTCSILTPSICLVLRGAKRLQLGSEQFDYFPGEFLASTIDIPVSGQVISGSKESPYIGLNIKFTIEEIASVAFEAKIILQTCKKESSIGAFIGKADITLLEVFLRLLKLEDEDKKSDFLFSLYKREMIFRLLQSKYGHLLANSVILGQQGNGVGNAITWIKENYAMSFTVESLAKANNMSVSGLQHKFKAVTTMGPLQYQKQLRLQAARRLMLNDSIDAGTAALTVGYESSSQFSREYKRLFGLPPQQDIKALQSIEAPYGV